MNGDIMIIILVGTKNAKTAAETKITTPDWQFGPGGHAYVYLCYGLHMMLNIVADKEGAGAAILIRSCAPVNGLATIQEHRHQKYEKPVLLTGPGKHWVLPHLGSSSWGQVFVRYSLGYIKARRARVLISQVWKWRTIVLKSSALLSIWVFPNGMFPTGGKSAIEGVFPLPYFEYIHVKQWAGK